MKGEEKKEMPLKLSSQTNLFENVKYNQIIILRKIISSVPRK
jgi:hypothetical protein